jgi:hypothetical protein
VFEVMTWRELSPGVAAAAIGFESSAMSAAALICSVSDREPSSARQRRAAWTKNSDLPMPIVAARSVS